LPICFGSLLLQTRGTRAGYRGRVPSKATTPWGPAVVVDEVAVEQQADERRFASLVQLLETADGERLLRFAYGTDGAVRRNPVTLRMSDLGRLREALSDHPELSATIGVETGARPPRPSARGPRRRASRG
jgi:hypothetical protein